MKLLGIGIAILMIISIALYSVFISKDINVDIKTNAVPQRFSELVLPSAIIPPTPTLQRIPERYIIPQQLHVFQTFNNCGPATLAMALSYLGLSVSQQELGEQLRPYQIVSGDNDDKNVSLYEVVEESKRRGFVGYVRPNGYIQLLKQLIAADTVVITRTWLGINDDIGHFRIVRGYDDTTGELIQDDSYQGKNIRFSYTEFDTLWRTFNYEYAVIVPVEKQAIVEQLLGNNIDEHYAWEQAKDRIDREFAKEPENWHLQFARSRIFYYLGDHTQAVETFRKVESLLSFRTLWYQPEPLYSLYELGRYEEVLQKTQAILDNHNRAYSELYFLRGNVYKALGDTERARKEYENAVYYNRNEPRYQQVIQSL